MIFISNENRFFGPEDLFSYLDTPVFTPKVVQRMNYRQWKAEMKLKLKEKLPDAKFASEEMVVRGYEFRCSHLSTIQLRLRTKKEEHEALILKSFWEFANKLQCNA